MEIKTVILDSTFIIQAIKENIDFVEEILQKGLKVAVLRESIQGIKDMALKSRSSRAGKPIVEKALRLFEDSRVDIKTSGQSKLNDWLVKRGNEGFFIATKEKEVLNTVPRKVIIQEGRVKFFDDGNEI